MVYNNVGLISRGAEDVASENPENQRFRLPHFRLTPRLQGTPANIRVNFFYCQKLVIALHRRRDLPSFKFSWWAPKTHVLKQSGKRPFKVIQGH